jgi:hypothetical protein
MKKMRKYPCLLLVAATIGIGAPAVAAPAHHPHHVKKLTTCVMAGVRRAEIGSTVYYTENSWWGRRAKQCIRVRSHREPGFTVTRSPVQRRRNAVVEAYPDTYAGCWYGLCTAGTVLPAKVSRLTELRVSWDARTVHHGVWNASLDIWLSTKRNAGRHQPNKAEVMVWLKNRKAMGLRSHKLRADGRSWWLATWRTRHDGRTWRYIQFRLIHPASHVVKLNVLKLLNIAARRHLIRRRWYVQDVKAGFEIWSGGKGLSSRYLKVMAKEIR